MLNGDYQLGKNSLQVPNLRYRGCKKEVCGQAPWSFLIDMQVVASERRKLYKKNDPQKCELSYNENFSLVLYCLYVELFVIK